MCLNVVRSTKYRRKCVWMGQCGMLYRALLLLRESRNALYKNKTIALVASSAGMDSQLHCPWSGTFICYSFVTVGSLVFVDGIIFKMCGWASFCVHQHKFINDDLLLRLWKQLCSMAWRQLSKACRKKNGTHHVVSVISFFLDTWKSAQSLHC